jgi:Flp pilus assembly secretin CpaC
MHGKFYQPALALLLSWILSCPPLPAQAPQSGSLSDDVHAMVKPDPKRAKKLVDLGAKQEMAGQYEQALAAYDQAARFAPFDVSIVGKAAALRSKLVQAHVDKAEQLAVKGDFLEASEELASALQIDPTNTILMERLKQVDSMRAQAKDVAQQEPPEGMPQLVPLKEKKNFRLQTDVQSAYQQVAAAYGLKATFDPELPARNVKLRLEDADFDTAMKVLTMESGTFWTALNTKLIFVAPDTPEKRKAFETEIEQTFLLPDSASAPEMTEVVKAVRDLTGTTRVQQSNAAHTITIRDTVPRVKLAGAVIKDLEQPHGEVLLEVEFLEVDRNNAMKLGITPPPSLTLFDVPPNLANQLRSAPSYTALLTLLASIFGTVASGGLSSLASAIPPIAAIGGGKTTFLLTLPTVSADFSKSLSLVQSGRQVLMRAQDGKPATFFLGQRYPVTLSLLSASLGNTGLTPAVGGTAVTLPTQQFPVGKGPVALTNADFRGTGNQDVAVVNQVDNTLTILLNLGLAAARQFVQAPGSPITLGPPASGSTPSGITSPAVSLTVSNATLQSIVISPAVVSIAPRATSQFTAVGTFSDGTSQDISSNVNWTSSNSAVASIGAQSGLALGVGAGTTQVTASLGSITSAPAALTGTTATVQSISVSPATISLARYGTQQFTATGTFSDGTKQNVTASASWSSSTPGVASIGIGSGLVRAINAGSTQITATVGGATSAPAGVSVTSATLKSITVTPVNLSIAPGTSVQYTATGTFTDGTMQDVTASVAWSSSATRVATIGASSGVATGVAGGVTSITASQGGAGSPAAIAAGSLNSLTDSIPDLVVASQINNSVIVLLGKGDGTFTNPAQAVSYVVGNQPSGIVLGTFNINTDGNQGFVVTNFADNSYSSFTGNGDGTFTEVKGSPFHLPAGETGPVGITTGDFNGDGKPDLAILNETSNNVTILEGNGDGTFTEFNKSPIPTGSFPIAIANGILAGSTGPGLAIANQNDNSVTVYLGKGDGTFTVASQSPLATTSAPGGLTMADFAGTSTGGIAVTNRSSGTVTVYVDIGSGFFTKALELAAGINPDAIVASTFTGNTFPDLLVTNNISAADGAVTLLVSPASAVASPLTSQTPYPGSEYVDIGLKVKAIPFVHPDDQVTLQMEYSVTALSGSNNNGIPVISNEAVTQTIRLKEGETSLISGLLDRENTKSLKGIQGLAKIPYLGYLFGAESTSVTDNELLILITPRKVHASSRQAKDIYAGRGEPSGRGAAGGGAPAPSATEPQESQPENQPAAAPVAPVAPQPGAPRNPQPPANPENEPQPGTPPVNPPPTPPAQSPPQR